MKRMGVTVLLGLVLLFPAAQSWAAPAKSSDAQGESLYQRLGGYNAMAAVTDEMMKRLTTDPQLKRFFVGFSDDSKQRIRQHFVDFLCNATGGPCLYKGRDMKTAHTGLNITEEDWQAAVKDLTATLDKFKVPEKEKGEVLSAVSGLKGDIVGR